MWSVRVTPSRKRKNLREAVELYIEEMGIPEGVSSEATIIARFEVKVNDKVASAVGS